jgi:hypothetical protein
VHTGVIADLSGRHQAAVRRTATTLAPLQERGWVVLHDVPRPGRRHARIDHIAVGPGGVVVIDTRDWSGTVEMSDGVLRQNGISRERERAEAEEAAAAVTAWLEPAQRTAVRPLVCLVGRPSPAPQTAGPSVCGLDDLVSTLRALPCRLRTDEVWSVADLLLRRLGDASAADQLTTAALAVSIAEDGGSMEPARTGLRERVRSLARRTRRLARQRARQDAQVDRA